MGWDASRPVPWSRLIKEWLVYAAIMVVVLALLFRDQGVLPLVAGVVVSGPIFVVLGAVLAKFGYQRKTLADLRTPRANAPTATAPVERSRPAPTRRTSTGTNRPRRKR